MALVVNIGPPRLLAAMMEVGGDGEELGVAVEGAEIVGDAGDTDAAAVLRFGDHALEGFEAAFVDNFGDLRDFAAEEPATGGGEGAEHAHGEDGVSDDEFAGGVAFEVEAEDFVARQAGHDGHGLVLCTWFRGSITEGDE